MSLVDVFLEPTRHFEAQRERPTVLLPLALFVLAVAGFTLAYFLRVDPDWYADFALTMAGREMTAAEIAQAKQFMPSARVQGYIGAVVLAIVLPLMFALFALYYFLAGKVAGAALSFKHAFALVVWASLPGLLGYVVGLVGAFTMAPQTPQHALMLTHVDPLLVQLPFDHAFSSLAKQFDLLALWSIGLTALGWKVMTRGGWGGALFVALLPNVLIYGAWLAWALTR